MATPKQEELVLEIAIEEQRRVYDQLSAGYDATKVKSLTFLGAGLALLTYLYSSGNLFIPIELYGRIFYFAGLALVVGSLSTLIYTLKTSVWEFPTDYRDLQNVGQQSRLEYLRYVKSQYLHCWSNNVRVYQRRAKILDASFMPLVIGAIILIVIKTF